MLLTVAEIVFSVTDECQILPEKWYGKCPTMGGDAPAIWHYRRNSMQGK